MTYPESHLDLLQAPGVGMLSTITPEGAIQTTAIWYLFDDGELKFSLSDARKKFRNLAANPSANFFILDLANPFRFIEIRGTAELAVDEGAAFRDRVGQHYGADLSGMDQPGDQRYVVTLRPTSIRPS
jgi:PPOX class probable F420-dependent enzyme